MSLTVIRRFGIVVIQRGALVRLDLGVPVSSPPQRMRGLSRSLNTAADASLGDGHRVSGQALAIMSASAISQKNEQAGSFSLRRIGPSPRSRSEKRTLVVRLRKRYEPSPRSS